MTAFARGFRLHLRHGQVMDGAVFPNGRAIVLDDPEWGLCSGARTIELLQAGYGGARIEWDEQAPAEPSQPNKGCEHCGNTAAHLPGRYMKGGIVGYCHGELPAEQQPTGETQT
ncbi:hypothetical protein [Streptomyces sp. NPDC058620]|uniref:hypothetical protein n=1 Tax=Streptomyces sp. NPDC058620 TaxID=3346560 RepID=UPI00365BB634